MTKPKSQQFSPEVRERAVRMVQEHQGEYETQWAAIRSIAEKIGCSAEALRTWLRRAERDAGQRPGLTTDDQQRLKGLEREVRELRRANEILRKASVESIGQCNTPSGLLYHRASWPRSVAPASRRTSDKKYGSAGEPATPSR